MDICLYWVSCCELHFPRFRSRKQDIVLFMNVLVGIGFQLSQCIEHRTIGVAGIFGNGVSVGQAAQGFQSRPGILMFLFQHLDRSVDRAASQGRQCPRRF